MDGVYKREALLYVVQVDHLTGESVGQSIEQFYAAGASNVQVVSAVTKKNRPSYMFFIDCKTERADAVEETIVRELHTGGWHKIRTDHCYLHSEIVTVDVCIQSEGECYRQSVQGKRFIGGGIRPEYESVAALKKVIQERSQKKMDHDTLYALVMAALLDERARVLKV